MQKYHNTTACQVLGNLCALTLHDIDDVSRDTSPCAVLHNLIFVQRYQVVPHLFYESKTTQVPIINEDITTVYKLRETDQVDSKKARSPCPAHPKCKQSAAILNVNKNSYHFSKMLTSNCHFQKNVNKNMLRNSQKIANVF